MLFEIKCWSLLDKNVDSIVRLLSIEIMPESLLTQGLCRRSKIWNTQYWNVERAFTLNTGPYNISPKYSSNQYVEDGTKTIKETLYLSLQFLYVTLVFLRYVWNKAAKLLVEKDTVINTPGLKSSKMVAMAKVIHNLFLFSQKEVHLWLSKLFYKKQMFSCVSNCWET